jgi:pimeloyl-ACP methyl ester carboxylesterase
MQDKLAKKKISSIMLDYPGVDRSLKSTDQKYDILLEYHRTIGKSLNLFSKKPIVIGHGIGGAIAQLWALTYKFELKNLILIDSAPYAIYSIYNLIQPAVNQFIAGTLPIVQFGIIVANASYNTVSDDCQPDVLKLDLANSIGNADPNSLKSIFTENPDNNAIAQAPQLIRIPTLIVQGTHDISVSPTGSDALNLLIPGSSILKLSTCHSPHFTTTFRFYEELYRFINPNGTLYFK